LFTSATDSVYDAYLIRKLSYITTGIEGGALNILRRAAVVIALSLSLTACASYTAKPNPAAGYAYQHKDFDFRYAWNTKSSDDGLRVDGLIKNVRYDLVQDVTLRLSLLNKDHKVISQGVALPLPQTVPLDDYRSFQFVFKDAKLQDVAELRFGISYIGVETGPQGINWNGDFTVDAATGLPTDHGRKPAEEW
jgi:hypothetical protein